MEKTKQEKLAEINDKIAKHNAALRKLRNSKKLLELEIENERLRGINSQADEIARGYMGVTPYEQTLGNFNPR